jgi:hypothetical protein
MKAIYETINAKKALKLLGNFLPSVSVIELEMYRNSPGQVGICITVARIIHEYNSSQDNEDRVCELLSIVLKSHFNRKP